MQDQNQLAQAQQSILHLQHAIHQAQSHPNEEIMQQIKHSLERAKKSLAQAESVTDDDNALDLVRRELAQQEETYQEISDREI